jgi:N-acyl-D-aspartate/D-glutamate deacylase
VRADGEQIVFRNGSVFDGSRFLPAGTCVRIRGGQITEVGPADSAGSLRAQTSLTWTAARPCARAATGQ